MYMKSRYLTLIVSFKLEWKLVEISPWDIDIGLIMFMRTWFSVDIFSLKVLSLHDEYRKSVFCRMIGKTDQKLSQFSLNWRIQCFPICWFCCEINLKNIQKFSNLHHDMSRLNFYSHASVTFTLMVFFISTWITSTMNASSKINNNVFELFSFLFDIYAFYHFDWFWNGRWVVFICIVNISWSGK